MARPRFERAHEVVDLASDGEDEVFSGDELEFYDAELNGDDAVVNLTDMSGVLEELNARYSPVYGAADGIIDLTAIPDIDVPPSDDPILIEDWTTKYIDEMGSADLVTEATCLQMVLNVLPDISIEHVLKLIKEKTANLTRTVAQCEGIVTQLLDGETYPKEVDEAKNSKRKRDSEEEDWSTYEKGERDPALPSYETEA
jgi:TRIAD3 protein (E3 ubiquitin-protein ligase RNF216)